MSRNMLPDSLSDIALFFWMDITYYYFNTLSLNAPDLPTGKFENFQEKFVVTEK